MSQPGGISSDMHVRLVGFMFAIGREGLSINDKNLRIDFDVTASRHGFDWQFQNDDLSPCAVSMRPQFVMQYGVSKVFSSVSVNLRCTYLGFERAGNGGRDVAMHVSSSRYVGAQRLEIQNSGVT